MKVTERDNLLIRLDERTRNIWHTIEQMEVHFGKLNDSVANSKVSISINRKWLGGISGIICAIITLKVLGIF